MIILKKEITGTLDVSLILLKILREETNTSQKYSKEYLIKRVSGEYRNTDEESLKKLSSQTFDRAIEKLLMNNFEIKIDMNGYYYDRTILSREDYEEILINALSDDKVSTKDYKSLFCNAPYGVNVVGYTKENDKYFLSDISKLSTVVKAIQLNKEVSYKIYSGNEISNKKKSIVEKMYIEDSLIKIILNNQIYTINEIINMKVED